MIDKDKIEELLTRNVEEVIDRKHLEERLLSGQKLRIKLGIDPTSPSIHIGRAVVLWKLRAFQDLGHQVLFMVGDFTGLVGDTSDKDAERPMLTEEQIKRNMKTYMQQAFKILDPKKTETSYNSKWLKKLGFIDIAQMADLFSLHEFEARENISKRHKAGKRISFREMMYPLMQGYDSVALKADVELGGSDQRFNLLAGRTIQKAYGQEPQDILTVQLLEGTDGRKMSSSWGNVINLTDESKEMYGKVMSVPDNLVEKYFSFATNLPLTEIKKLVKEKQPYELKRRLAKEIVSLYHGEIKAQAADDNFTSQFSKKELPDEIQSVKLKPGKYKLSDLMLETKLVASKSEARRLIEQKGVKINQETAEDGEITIKEKNDLVLQVGKRKFIRIK